MNPQTIESIKNALTPIADKIGAGAGYIWASVVRGQVIQGYTDIGVGILMLLFVPPLIYSVFNVYKLFTKSKVYFYSFSDEVYPDSLKFCIGLLSFCAIIALLWGMMSIQSGIVEIAAPEYSALNFFIHLESTPHN